MVFNFEIVSVEKQELQKNGNVVSTLIWIRPVYLFVRTTDLHSCPKYGLVRSSCVYRSLWLEPLPSPQPSPSSAYPHM